METDKSFLVPTFNMFDTNSRSTKKATTAESEAHILEYDVSQALDDLPEEMEDPLQCARFHKQTSCNNCHTGSDSPSKEKNKLL